MSIIANGLVLLVAALHIWFLILEMVLWQKPLGMKTFRMSPEKAAGTAVLAANQGLYNGFLAAGLLFSTFIGDQTFQTFFLTCVIIAGLYGAHSVNRKIFFVQSLPAIIALIFLII
jgi:putative membrane protein